MGKRRRGVWLYKGFWISGGFRGLGFWGLGFRAWGFVRVHEGLGLFLFLLLLETFKRALF